MSFFKTCVAPSGVFVYGIHKPRFRVCNLRETDPIVTLGETVDGGLLDNEKNFPRADPETTAATWVFEIPNPFPFMGSTFIPKGSADSRVDDCNPFRRQETHGDDRRPLADLGSQPRAVLLALARTSKDPDLLSRLAQQSCRFVHDPKSGLPAGLLYEHDHVGRLQPAIADRHLFELVSNNLYLPDVYKQYMVLMPGAQGDSPIVGEYRDGNTHIWEYLRENSYVPWGHYAANMAQDAIRYRIGSLSGQDMTGLRHLYYQRIYGQLASELGIPVPARRKCLTGAELENLRLGIVDAIRLRMVQGAALPFNANIWGQNFGFDLSASGYRLNASHQQIHQQYAPVPPSMPAFGGGEPAADDAGIPTFVLGDLVAQYTSGYRDATGRGFFDAYLSALAHNKRMDGKTDAEHSLIVLEDEYAVAFVPKAQRSQGEIQIMTKTRCGNIVEADGSVRAALDRLILTVLKTLEALGAELVTVFEISKRFDNADNDQRLLYCFLPKHPQSPGSFTEFQQRWIIGHYPEDFARTCRRALIS
jgi:hypothetical protein